MMPPITATPPAIGIIGKPELAGAVAGVVAVLDGVGVAADVGLVAVPPESDESVEMGSGIALVSTN